MVVDRGPRTDDQAASATPQHHEITPAVAERDITRHGFQAVVRDDRFIDRPTDDEVWWLMVFRKALSDR